MGKDNIAQFTSSIPPHNFQKFNIGDFIICISNVNNHFEYKQLWWLLLPILGWLICLLLVIRYLCSQFNTKNIYIFESGFVWERSRKGKTKSQVIIAFDNVEDITISRTDNYTNGIYGATNVKLQIDYYDHSKEKWCKFKRSTSEHNRDNIPSKWNWATIAFLYIFSSWEQYKDSNS